jgi:hypothetical protein
MIQKITNTLALCSVLLGFALLPAHARQTASYYDITTEPSPPSDQPYSPPTPTTTLQQKQKYSQNDPFRIFAPPSEPVCCLIPLPDAKPDPHPTDDLLTFEEWKAKQLALNSTEPRYANNPNERLNSVAYASDESWSAQDTTNDILIPVIETSGAPTDPSVEEFIPVEGRFNYASLDCSARVHSAHKSMKSASSILSSKKDKYMLAPCSEGMPYHFAV